MKDTLTYLRHSLFPRDFRMLLSDIAYRRDTYYTIFPHSGILLFCGSQGTGKTTSAVDYLYCLLQDYPRARVVTNVDLCFVGFPNEIVRYTEVSDLEKYGSNGSDGVIFLLDEIHLIWNSLESMSITPQDMIEFAQSRKQRRLIIGTSQRINRLAKPVREQLKYVVECQCLFSCLQRNILYDIDTCVENLDGSITLKDGRVMWFWHDYVVRKSYNTFQKMQRIGGAKWRK